MSERTSEGPVSDDKALTGEQHTPGPWTVMVPRNARGQELPPRIVQEGKAGLIATLGFAAEGSREANAALIASAPALRERVARLTEALAQIAPLAYAQETVPGTNNGYAILKLANDALLVSAVGDDSQRKDG